MNFQYLDPMYVFNTYSYCIFLYSKLFLNCFLLNVRVLLMFTHTLRYITKYVVILNLKNVSIFVVKQTMSYIIAKLGTPQMV